MVRMCSGAAKTKAIHQVEGPLKFINHSAKPNACYYDDLTVVALLIAANTVRVVVTPANNNGVLSAGQIATIPWTINATAVGGTEPLTITNIMFTDSNAAVVVAGSFSHGSVRINYAPVASNSTITTNEDQAVSGNLIAADNDNEPLAYSIVTNSARGSVTLTNSGAFAGGHG